MLLKKYLLTTLFAVFVLSFFAFAQTELPPATEVFSKDDNRLISLGNLRDVKNKKVGTFRGKLTNVEFFTRDPIIYFDLKGRGSFRVNYKNASEKARAQLKTLFHNGNQITVRAYASGGIWLAVKVSGR